MDRMEKNSGMNFLLINYDYLFVIFCDRIKYKATKKIFIR